MKKFTDFYFKYIAYIFFMQLIILIFLPKHPPLLFTLCWTILMMFNFLLMLHRINELPDYKEKENVAQKQKNNLN